MIMNRKKVQTGPVIRPQNRFNCMQFKSNVTWVEVGGMFRIICMAVWFNKLVFWLVVISHLSLQNVSSVSLDF